ncbi:MAG: hypothetical protein IJ679_12835 [Lachnospiraceae bacterium]|nr:hypothetical protein [Lachnospiraceae bacterium]
MIQTDEFKRWLRSNTEYSDAVIGDTASRIKRADNILNWSDTDTYLFYLEKEHEFEVLSVSVRSQLRRAVKLYAAYTASKGLGTVDK